MNILEWMAVVVAAVSFIGAIITFFKYIFKLKDFIEEVQNQSKQIQELQDAQREMKKEQRLIFSSLFACLDGLEQLGANHTVPKAKEDLVSWLNTNAH